MQFGSIIDSISVIEISKGIDKLTRRRRQALPDRDHSTRYVVASAHSHDVFRSNCAGYFHIPIAELVNLSIPLGGTETSGLDLDLRYSFSAGGAGDFTTQLTWSHVNNFVFDANDGLGFQQQTFTPDDRMQWNLNWSLSDYSATLIGNYINSTPIGGGEVLDDWTTWDLQLNWATPWNGRVTVGARNLFDKDPPLNAQLGNPFYSNRLHDIFGRVPYIRYTQEL